MAALFDSIKSWSVSLFSNEEHFVWVCVFFSQNAAAVPFNGARTGVRKLNLIILLPSIHQTHLNIFCPCGVYVWECKESAKESQLQKMCAENTIR